MLVLADAATPLAPLLSNFDDNDNVDDDDMTLLRVCNTNIPSSIIPTINRAIRSDTRPSTYCPIVIPANDVGSNSKSGK